MLCSSSVRIWDYTQDACVSVLSGHSGPVRGLLWSPEIPYLLVSGSWDYTVRVWDTREGTCLDTVYDHGADVYGKVFLMLLHCALFMMTVISEQYGVFKKFYIVSF